MLLINDYRTDPAYERVIEQLVDEKGKRLYDVIGIQSHMHGGVWSNGQIWKVCQEFSRFGVPLHFTETTILSGERVWEKDSRQPVAVHARGRGVSGPRSRAFLHHALLSSCGRGNHLVGFLRPPGMEERPGRTRP